MSPEQRLAFARLVTDYQQFSAKALKIVPKAGGHPVPFVWNEAQAYLHRKLEEQRTHIRRVRALLLKGRQQGACFAPHMRVLTADYRWVAIGEVRPGQLLLGVDEDPVNGVGGKRQARKVRTCVVEAVARLNKPAFRVSMSNGAEIVVTAEHRMLCRKRGGTDAQWREIGKTRMGDVIRAACDPPVGVPGYEDGWFGGMLDGEGSMRVNGSIRLSVHQVEGPVLDRLRAYLDRLGVSVGIVVDDRPSGTSSKLGGRPVHRLDLHRLSDVVKVLSVARPTRFCVPGLFDGQELGGKGTRSDPPQEPWARVDSIEAAGEIEVVDLQTSTKTYVCEGLVSHNSTYVEGRIFWRIATCRGLKAYVLAHEQAASDNLFAMVDRYYKNLPKPKPSLGASNAKELVFDLLESRIQVATAGSKDTGRSGTAQLMHGSEVAFWPHADDHLKGIGQTVPSDHGTEVVLESTANGTANQFHEMWQQAVAGRGDYMPVFIPWFWQKEYTRKLPFGFELDHEEIEYQEAFGLTLEQMAWRRAKTDTDFKGDTNAFDQEYPGSPELAFASSSPKALIPVLLVSAARKNRDLQPVGRKVMGVDPAEYGDDETSVWVRQGRVARKCKGWVGASPTESVARIGMIADAEQPDVIYVDGTNSAAIGDMLSEQGYPVVNVHFGAGPRDTEHYVTCRDEMWCGILEWLQDKPCSITDENSVAAQLTSVEYSYDSKRRRKLEPKEKMKARGLRSPDDGDALALTFYWGGGAATAEEANAFRRRHRVNDWRAR